QVRFTRPGGGHSGVHDQLSDADLALLPAEPEVHVHRPRRLRALRPGRGERTVSAAAIVVAVAPVRREPAHASECVTQALHGEGVEILEPSADGAWLRVRLATDGYEGW